MGNARHGPATLHSIGRPFPGVGANLTLDIILFGLIAAVVALLTEKMSNPRGNGGCCASPSRRLSVPNAYLST